MSWLSDFLNPGKAYKQAGEVEQAGYNESKGYRQPFIENGVGAGNNLKDMLNKLMNPGKLQNEWSQGYETSPYAQQLQKQNQTQGLDAASAMGIGGSSAALSNIQKGSGDIVQKDRQNYMDDMMKKYMAAMGIGESMYGTGATTANAGAEGAQKHGEWQGQNTFNEKSARTEQIKQMLPMIIAAMTGGGSGGFPGFGGMTSDMYGGS